MDRQTLRDWAHRFNAEGAAGLINHGPEDFTIRRGDRIAQLVIAPVVQAQWAEVVSLDETVRGAGGFGSTGISLP